MLCVNSTTHVSTTYVRWQTYVLSSVYSDERSYERTPQLMVASCGRLKVECLLTLAIWSYWHEAEEYIFLNLPFPSNSKENSSIRCILSTLEQNLL